MAYNALYPDDKLEIPSEMCNTAYYLPRSSFPAVESHLLTSARTKVELPIESTNRANLTNPGDIRLGDTVYSSIQTMGIGVNMSSYERFMGDGLPGLLRHRPTNLFHLTLSGEEPIQIRSGPGLTPTKIPNNVPMQTFFIIPCQKPFPDPIVPNTQLLQCLYWPTEFAIEYMVQRHHGSPLLVKRNHYLREPRSVNPIYARPTARAIHELLTTNSAGGKVAGGVLGEVLQQYYKTHPQTPKSDQWTKRNANMIHQTLVEPALSATAEAYFSLSRQRVEISNVWLPLYGDDTDVGGEHLALENLENERLTNGVVFLILRRLVGRRRISCILQGFLVMVLIGGESTVGGVEESSVWER